ncbi:MAG: hypothetical protein HY070_11425 [Chloroflexi bacterium]|nr:hypothetical protein [Chloroflexota bacterium]MBI3740805.1 hypothetical protein [Chloroflexota bacterium]
MPIPRPDIHTLYQIDLAWFENNNRDFRSELHSALCEECRARYPDASEKRAIDRVHPTTAEISRVDALWESVVDHCALRADYIAPTTPMTIAIPRALFANGNQPMSSEQLYQRIRKNSAEGILRVLNKGTDIEFMVQAENAKK